MRCQVCGKLISGQPVTRKTCCVNKLYIFCSEGCLNRWAQSWLRSQEQVPSIVNAPSGKRLIDF